MRSRERNEPTQCCHRGGSSARAVSRAGPHASRRLGAGEEGNCRGRERRSEADASLGCVPHVLGSSCLGAGPPREGDCRKRERCPEAAALVLGSELSRRARPRTAAPSGWARRGIVRRLRGRQVAWLRHRLELSQARPRASRRLEGGRGGELCAGEGHCEGSALGGAACIALRGPRASARAQHLEVQPASRVDRVGSRHERGSEAVDRAPRLCDEGGGVSESSEAAGSRAVSASRCVAAELLRARAGAAARAQHSEVQPASRVSVC